MPREFGRPGATRELLERLHHAGADFECLHDVVSFENSAPKVERDTIEKYRERILAWIPDESRALEEEEIDIDLSHRHYRHARRTELAMAKSAVSSFRWRDAVMPKKVISLFRAFFSMLGPDPDDFADRSVFGAQKAFSARAIALIGTKVDPLSAAEQRFRNDDPEFFKRKEALVAERTWLRGAEGEESVAAALRGLPPGYVVFHDWNYHFQPSYFDREIGQRVYNVQIDHIVVGRTGVWAIETKNYASAASVDPAWTPFRQAKRAKKALWICLDRNVPRNWGMKPKVPVNALVVAVGAALPREQGDVWVVRPERLATTIQNGKTRLDEGAISQVERFLLEGISREN